MNQELLLDAELPSDQEFEDYVRQITQGPAERASQKQALVDKELKSLISAIGAKNVELALELIEQKASILQELDDEEKPTPLHIAARYGLITVIEALIKANPALLYLPVSFDDVKDDEKGDENYKIPAAWALEFDQINALKYIYDQMKKPEGTDSEIFRAYDHYYYKFIEDLICYIIKNNDLEMLKFYVSDNTYLLTNLAANWNRIIDKFVEEEKLDLLNWAIEFYPACIDEMSQENNTLGEPLDIDTLISHARNIRVVKFLIDKGYKFYAESVVDVINNFGPEGLNLLKEKNISLSLMDDNGFCPIHIAAKKGDILTLRILLEQGVNIDQENKANETALEFLLRERTALPKYSINSKSPNGMLFLIYKGSKLDFSNPEISILMGLSWSYMLEVAIETEYGIPAVVKLLQIQYSKTKESNNDFLSMEHLVSFCNKIFEYIYKLEKLNFIYKKDIKKILEYLPKLKAAHMGCLNAPGISEKEQSAEHYAFNRLKEMIATNWKIVKRDNDILGKGAFKYLSNPNIKGEIATSEADQSTKEFLKPYKSLEKAKEVGKKAADAMEVVYNTITSFLSLKELENFYSNVVPPIYFDIASTELSKQKEIDQPKRQKLGDCYIEAAE